MANGDGFCLADAKQLLAVRCQRLAKDARRSVVRLMGLNLRIVLTHEIGHGNAACMSLTFSSRASISIVAVFQTVNQFVFM